ncbi:hypothetical protein A5784_13715 [Mycobacterium sp. 852013-50091_SCH5140682]|uniref:hypothetical protein n=1 Tax=Mycobacterium sp. 852013-50091_SCH5140682 TaxID=1834109 RepID=UPI0007E9CB4C|nr:hypothetical protein [Mycobacterium sp. 852013-50091_SCH5140682]OBC04604.1 hypothetical protein A5784_13715 [Mycobacterium sp. 852013-50091_SCH5140682]
MRRRTNWWLVALISAAVVLSCVGLTLVIGFVVFFVSFADDDNVGPHQLDAKAAAKAMEQRRIGIPAGFTFEAMTVQRVFSGADGYTGRYAAAGRFDDAEHALAQANPDFPALRRATCADEIVHHDFAEFDGFHCDARTELAVSTRSLDGEDVLTDNYSGTPPDAETVLLAGNGDQVELFVLSRGH